MTPITTDELGRIELFAGLTPEALAWLAAHAEESRHDSGARIFEPEEPAERMFVVVEGELQLLFELGGQWIVAATHERGSATGMLPFSRMTHYNVRGVAVGALRLFGLHRRHFAELVQVSPELGQRLVGMLSDRVREAAKIEQQMEKMASLGKLSAGLAHELNNPAAAVQRAVAALRERLAELPTLTSRLTAHSLTTKQVCAADALRTKRDPAAAAAATAVERAAREEAMSAWLEARGLADPWNLAPTLVEAGVAQSALERLVAEVPEAAASDLISWLAATVEADRLLEQIGGASTRISELVAAIKNYSHMDRTEAPRPVDLHAGLTNTLTMLGHVIRKRNVRIETEFDRELPPVTGLAGQLNQVWTNLIDNAIDAAGDGGTVRVVTRRDDADPNTVIVRVADDGPGIAPEHLDRIFEPFYTTKAVGEGTGLGLDIVQRIVRLHQGQVVVDSEPGRTVFAVRLPIEPPAGNGGGAARGA
jgi:signal transduction histidine kinase